VPPEAWQDFKDQVAAIVAQWRSSLGEKHSGTVTLRYDYDVETNTITVSVAKPN
jgi:hypothetical protein